MAHKELNQRERRAIEDMLNAKIAVREIAAEIGRHVSTVYREIKRNFVRFGDQPEINGYYGLIDSLSALPAKARRSITFDSGTEFSACSI